MVRVAPGVTTTERGQAEADPSRAPVPSRHLVARIGPLLHIPAEERPGNLVAHVWRVVEQHPDREAMRWKAGGVWVSRTYGEMADDVLRTALGLHGLAVAAGTRVAIISSSRPEWLVCDLACLSLGAVTCPIHPSESNELIGFMLANVEAEVVLAESRQQLAKVQAARDRCPTIRLVILFEDRGTEEGATPDLASIRVTGAIDDAALREWRTGWGRIGPDALATIVHTSGTTGTPKGVMLTHGNILHNCLAAAEAIPFSPDDVGLTILPLSHMFARSAGEFVPLGIGAAVAFAEPVMERWASNLEEVRPTVMLTVPPFFQRIHRKVMADVAKMPRLQQAVFGWAVRLGPKRYAQHLAHRRESPWLRLQLWIARRLVFDRIRRRTGGRLRFFASGGAALPREVGEFFYAMGMQILEGYGLSETAPFLTLNRPASFKFGTVGEPFAETEIAIDQVSGEVLARGPQVMLGYLNLPEETAAAIDADRWFHTGDIGRFDDAGRLVITDRIKNLIVLANGKKVTPGPMETALTSSPYIAQAVVLGEGEERTGLLVAPNWQNVEEWARSEEIAEATRGDLRAAPQVHELIEAEMRRLLGEFPVYERPRRVVLLPRPLTEERGELTSLGKPKRAAITANWPDLVARLFPPHHDPGPA